MQTTTPTMPLSNTQVRDVETLVHPYTNLATHREVGPMVIERAKGIHVYDTSGKPHIEGMSGLWCTGLGYGNEELIAAATKQMTELSFTHLFGGKSHEPAIELADKLKELCPVPTSRIFYTSSGSEANDTQIKIAWYYNNALGRPQKKKIISRLRGYHGVTIASASLTGLPANHIDFDLPLPQVRHADCPHAYRHAEPGEIDADFATRLATSLEELIQEEGPDTIAAFIAEPVMGAGGVIIPPETYFEKIQAILKEHDILLIADEVICGFGRTGNMFGSQTFGMKPDTMSIAKALTSAYVPLGAVTVGEDVYDAMMDQSRKIGTFGHGFTYSGHPVSCAVANAVLKIYERDDIVGHVRGVSPTFEAHLKRLADHPLVGHARSVGLIGGVELVRNKETREAFDPKQGVSAKAVQFCQEEGLILRNLMGDVVGICPPLIITDAQIDEMFAALERALDRTLEWTRTLDA